MNNFFKNLGQNESYKKLMSDPLTYVAGAVLLSILNIVHVILLGSAWGVTSTFANWGAWVFEVLGGDVSNWAYFTMSSNVKSYQSGFFNDTGSLRNLGIIFGAMFATLMASQFKIKKIKSKKQVIAAILGGLLMGYGARIAFGCNIGALFSAISAWSLSGWVFMAFLFIGAFIGSKLLAKVFI